MIDVCGKCILRTSAPLLQILRTSVLLPQNKLARQRGQGTAGTGTCRFGLIRTTSGCFGSYSCRMPNGTMINSKSRPFSSAAYHFTVERAGRDPEQAPPLPSGCHSSVQPLQGWPYAPHPPRWRHQPALPRRLSWSALRIGLMRLVLPFNAIP